MRSVYLVSSVFKWIIVPCIKIPIINVLFWTLCLKFYCPALIVWTRVRYDDEYINIRSSPLNDIAFSGTFARFNVNFYVLPLHRPCVSLRSSDDEGSCFFRRVTRRIVIFPARTISTNFLLEARRAVTYPKRVLYLYIYTYTRRV